MQKNLQAQCLLSAGDKTACNKKIKGGIKQHEEGYGK